MGRPARRTRLKAVAALAATASLAQCPGKSLAFGPIESTRTTSSCSRKGPGDRLNLFSRSRTTPATQGNNNRGIRIHDRTGTTTCPRPSTQLRAFWARGTDAGTTDENKRSGNSFLRKILPRGNGSTDTGGGGSGPVLESEPGSATARPSSSSAVLSSKRKRTTGRSPVGGGSSGSNRTRTKSSSARYFYSAATLSEQCPTWVPGSDADECPIEEGVWGSYDDVAAAALSTTLNEHADADAADRQQQGQQKAASRLVEDALDGFIHRHALHTMNLKITSDATSRSAVLLKGELGDVHASFDRLSFPALKLSGGGRISATGLSLNTASFVPALGRFVRRWRNPFEFHAKDCVLTQMDLDTSRCIRIGLANIGTRILRRVVASDSSLDVVRIDRGARLAVSKVEILVSRK